MAAMLFPLTQPSPDALPAPQIPPKRKGETLRPPLEFVVLSHRS